MSDSARIFSLVSATAFDKHSDATSVYRYLAICDSMISEATVIPLFVFDRSKSIGNYGKDERSSAIRGSHRSRTFLVP